MALKVKFIGSSQAQVNWGGNDDPTGLLVPGEIYHLDHAEVHTWHTKYFLEEFPGLKFNSTSFEDAD